MATNEYGQKLVEYNTPFGKRHYAKPMSTKQMYAAEGKPWFAGRPDRGGVRWVDATFGKKLEVYKMAGYRAGQRIGSHMKSSRKSKFGR